MNLSDVAILGAGVAGLTAAAMLAKAGANVTVFEHHNVPGGCASFFLRDGYRFDVGATVVNGFGERGIHRRIHSHLGIVLDAHPLDPAMVVHLPNQTIRRYGDHRWILERQAAFGNDYEAFWRSQERIADRVWRASDRLPSLPADPRSILHAIASISLDTLHLLSLQGRTLASLLPTNASREFQAFVDMQLLITSQTSAGCCDLSFGATALDIAREGTFHLRDGIASIAIGLARSVRKHGGKIRYRTTVSKIHHAHGKAQSLELQDGSRFPVGHVIAAIPYENVLTLLGREIPKSLRTRQYWSAVTAYLGVRAGVVDENTTLHHQLLNDFDAPLGEANTAFVSISAPNESGRARNGGRAITISTHTDPKRWENAETHGTQDALKRAFASQLLGHAERAIGKSIDPDVFEIGTPATFQRYTLRHRGMVGGTPQTRSSANLLAHSHRSSLNNLLLCGDTIFPGQSTVGVSLSALNAVRALGVTLPNSCL